MAKTFDRERLKKLFAKRQAKHESDHEAHEARVSKMHEGHAKARRDLHDKHQKGRAALFEKMLKGMKDGPKGAPIYKTRIKQ